MEEKGVEEVEVAVEVEEAVVEGTMIATHHDPGVLAEMERGSGSVAQRAGMLLLRGWGRKWMRITLLTLPLGTTITTSKRLVAWLSSCISPTCPLLLHVLVDFC